MPFDTLVARDSKGLYKQALAGEIENVVGVDIEFPIPLRPDLVIDNVEDAISPRRAATQIVDAIPWIQS